jgi:hypothetical protein
MTLTCNRYASERYSAMLHCYLLSTGLYDIGCALWVGYPENPSGTRPIGWVQVAMGTQGTSLTTYFQVPSNRYPVGRLSMSGSQLCDGYPWVPSTQPNLIGFSLANIIRLSHLREALLALAHLTEFLPRIRAMIIAIVASPALYEGTGGRSRLITKPVPEKRPKCLYRTLKSTSGITRTLYAQSSIFLTGFSI